MASCIQQSWRFGFILSLGLLMLLGMARLSNGYPTSFKPSKWSIAHATFYGDDSASATMGGACGYGNLFKNGYGTNTAAVSTVLFKNGYGCGTCYQLMCVHSKWCNAKGRGGYYGNSITVTATNLCPPNWGQDSNAGGWCNPPRAHFDLSMPAFKKLAFWRAGIVPVQYRRVPCGKRGGIRFSFQGNNYWLLATVMNVGGAGDIAQMWVKGSRTGWISMSHNWGASYQAFGQLGGQGLSFKIQSYTTRQVIVAYNVVPPYWSTGMTFQARVNFR